EMSACAPDVFPDRVTATMFCVCTVCVGSLIRRLPAEYPTLTAPSPATDSVRASIVVDEDWPVVFWTAYMPSDWFVWLAALIVSVPDAPFSDCDNVTL